MMITAADLALAHFLLRLRPLNRALQVAVERQGRAAKRLIRPDVAPLCVTEDQVLTLLGDVDTLVNGTHVAQEPASAPTLAEAAPEELAAPVETLQDKAATSEPETPQSQRADSRLLLCGTRSLAEIASLWPEEHVKEQALRSESTAANMPLPLDRLSQALGLTPFEEEAVLLCAAPELDRSYERIYAYILDDLNRRYPCVELLCSLTADSITERVLRRHALARFGRLRRTRVLQPYGEPPTDLRQELRLAAGLFDYLTGGIEDMVSRFRDPAEAAIRRSIDLPPHVDTQVVDRLARTMREGRVSMLGVWGPQHAGHDQVVRAIAARIGKPLRRCLLPDTHATSEQQKPINEAVQAASALGTILWIATEPLTEPGGERLSQVVAEALAVSHVPIILTGLYPWRPLRILEARSYVEIELETPGYPARKAMWTQALPDVDEEQISGLAARFRVTGAEIRAAARLARTEAELVEDGHSASVSEQIERACAAVTRKRSHQFATVIKPKRGPDDLVLPPNLHAQVLEVAQFFQAWPRVAEEWGFGRLQTGSGGGIKALFTGDSGTGKTLAAEVIAGKLSMPLLKVDLARVVSKWVGETEQHLEAAFREAEDSHCVLFFDECDALFGKRGEVQHGVDRYANLEVSFLLQRLEDHYGLVILASNLKDNIDQAFIRRFQVVIHFPRPEPTERRRIWEIAFPEDSPLDPEADLDALSRLDMTGAAIVGAACTAGLLAANENSATITKSHVVRAIARQYRREARILTPAELGPYATELKEAK